MDLGDSFSRLIRGMTTFVAGIAGAMVLGFIETVALSRWLSPTDFGLFSLALTIGLGLGVIGQVGLAQGVKRFVGWSRGEDNQARANGVTAAGLLISSAMGVVIVVVLGGTREILARRVFDSPALAPLLVMAGVIAFAKATLDVASGSIIARDRPVLGALLGSFGQRTLRLTAAGAAWLVLSLGLATTKLGGIEITYTLAFGGVALAVIGGYLGYLTTTTIEWPSTELVAFSAPLVLSTAAGRVLSVADYILLGIIASPSAVGLYRPAFLISSTTILIYGAGNKVFQPTISEQLGADNTKNIRQTTETFRYWTFALSTPVCIWTALFADHILTAFFGTAYARAAIVVKIAALGFLATVAIGPIDSLLEALGRTRALALIYGVAAVLNLVLNVLLIPLYGIAGAATATMISLVAVRVIGWYAVRDEVPAAWRPRRFGTATAIAVGGLLPFTLVVSSPIRAIILSPIYMLLVVAGYLVLVPRTDADELLVSQVRKRVSREGG